MQEAKDSLCFETQARRRVNRDIKTRISVSPQMDYFVHIFFRNRAKYAFNNLQGEMTSFLYLV